MITCWSPAWCGTPCCNFATSLRFSFLMSACLLASRGQVLGEHFLVLISRTRGVPLPHQARILEHAAMVPQVQPAAMALPDRLCALMHTRSFPKKRHPDNERRSAAPAPAPTERA